MLLYGDALNVCFFVVCVGCYFAWYCCCCGCCCFVFWGWFLLGLIVDCGGVVLLGFRLAFAGLVGILLFEVGCWLLFAWFDCVIRGLCGWL